jgi:pilus assembly protein Flp/PilA
MKNKTRTAAPFVLLKIFYRHQSGATAIEYALIASLISISIMAALALLGGGVDGLWGFVVREVVAGLSG